MTVSEPVGWDTHADNFRRLRQNLPVVDQAVSALPGDLSDRGLLADTLVMMFGESGWTPAVNKQAGRDHWAHAFTALLAGGGVRGGQVYGATTRDGGYVADRPVTPADLTATVLHHLGIDHTREYVDEFQHLRNRLSDGQPVRDLG